MLSYDSSPRIPASSPPLPDEHGHACLDHDSSSSAPTSFGIMITSPPSSSSRPRSDTLLTTSSSSSFPQVQTPTSPSILGVLIQAASSASEGELRGKERGQGHGHDRQDSYGFSGFVASPTAPGPPVEIAGHERRWSESSLTFSMEDLPSESPSVERVCSQVVHNNTDIVTSSSSQTPDAVNSGDPGNSPSPIASQRVGPDVEEAPTSDSAVETVHTSSSSSSNHLALETIAVEPMRSTFKLNVRRKLARSRSSFKAAFQHGQRETETETGGAIIAGSAPADEVEQTTGEKRRRPRFRSLLSLSSRSQSTASIRSMISTSSGLTADRQIERPARNDGEPGEDRHQDEGSVRVRDFASVNPPEAQTRDSMTPRAIGLDELSGAVVLDSRSKGKGKIRSATLSSGPSYTAKSPTMSPDALFANGNPRQMIVRSMSTPLPATTWQGITSSLSDLKVDLFHTMLPRELQLMVLKKVVELWASSPRQDKWDGEIGGRRELIKLSRVSKYWQELCFDGQLWPIMNLAPFAPYLSPSGLHRILRVSHPYIKSLSLRGMNSLSGHDLVTALIESDSMEGMLSACFTLDSLHQLSSLVQLDLRGCKRIWSGQLIAIVRQAPSLRHLNLKGVQGVSGELLRTLARSSNHLESLDVSRCWDISICDMAVFLKMISDVQAAKIQSLRVAGLKAYANAARFLGLVAERLVSLEVLDMKGCLPVVDADFATFADVLDREGRISPIRHLILSNCAGLTSETFGFLAGRVGNLEKLELAGLPDAFPRVQEIQTNDGNDLKFIKLLKSLPKLERLDLEGTGLRSGVTDMMLDVLTPPRGYVGDSVGKELVELRIGYARAVTAEGLIRFIRGSPKLQILEADNTSATNAVMREFMRRRSNQAALSLIDCRAITPTAYSQLAAATRPREGWTDYAAVPMRYEDGDHADKAVLKTFWSWRRVGVGKGWRETLEDYERERRKGGQIEVNGHGSAGAGWGSEPVRWKRRPSWWTADQAVVDERAGCVVQ